MATRFAYRPMFSGRPSVKRKWGDRTADGTLHRLLTSLIAARVRAGLSQEQVALKMRTTKSAISRLESGRPT